MLTVLKNETANLSFKDKAAFKKMIDDLPAGTDWECHTTRITGNEMGPDGKPLVEEVETWMRNPVKIVEELIGNPLFKDFLAYEPVRLFRDKTRAARIYNEMWTADFWWNLLV